MSIYFWSDTHFNHRNIAGPTLSSWKEGYRNYTSVEDMNEALLDAINSRVLENDTLYHLGDFCMGQRHLLPAFRSRIRCKNIHLILGNHDDSLDRDKNKFNPAHLDCFLSVRHYREIVYKGQRICLFHFPQDVWNEHAAGSIHLYGHCHGSHDHAGRKRQDVGADVFAKPAPIEYIIDIMAERQIVKVDHHSKETSYH